MAQKSPFMFSSESLYKIKIQGKINDTWKDQIRPKKIIQEEMEKGIYETSFIFNTKDQAELMGLLNTMYELHLPILSLTRVQEK